MISKHQYSINETTKYRFADEFTCHMPSGHDDDRMEKNKAICELCRHYVHEQSWCRQHIVNVEYNFVRTLPRITYKTYEEANPVGECDAFKLKTCFYDIRYDEYTND